MESSPPPRAERPSSNQLLWGADVGENVEESWKSRSLRPGPPGRLRRLLNLLIAGSTPLLFKDFVSTGRGGETRKGFNNSVVGLKKSMILYLECLKS